MFGSTLMGIGAAAGSFLGGLLIEYYGLAMMYRVFGLVVLVSPVIFLLFERRLSAGKSSVPV
jgi:predicted MFS family arabinose efflux permease